MSAAVRALSERVHRPVARTARSSSGCQGRCGVRPAISSKSEHQPLLRVESTGQPAVSGRHPRHVINTPLRDSPITLTLFDHTANRGDPGTVWGMVDAARQPDDRDGRVALQRFAGFVRNVMVGRNGLSAEVLRELVAKAGGHDPRSHLATGNLTFSASPELLEVIRAGIEDSVESVLGRREDVFIRSVASLASAVRSDPFAEMMANDVYERCVTFVPAEPAASLSLPMQVPRGDVVLFDCRAGGVLSITRLISGRPGQPGRFLESTLGMRVTTRNWNTIERIVRLEG